MVFTKYDILVSAQVQSSTSIVDGSQLVKGRDMATSAFEELCIRPLRRISEALPVEKVSGTVVVFLSLPRSSDIYCSSSSVRVQTYHFAADQNYRRTSSSRSSRAC